MMPRELELSCSPRHLGMELVAGGEACVLVEVWRRQVSRLLFLSSQVFLFFRATYIQVDFFFKRDRIMPAVASMQANLSPDFLSCWFAWCCLRARESLSYKLLHRGGLLL